MSDSTSTEINAILPQYIPLLLPEYVEAYNKHVVGKPFGHQVSIEEFRGNEAKYRRGFGMETGPEIGEVKDINIPVSKPAGEITLRIYRPKQGGVTPALLNFHGGGWVVGKAGTDDTWIRRVVEGTGATVVDVGYRLAPEYKFPVATEDGWEALLYVREHAAELLIDKTRIALGGNSAGGQIAAVLSHMARDSGFNICFALLSVPIIDAAAIDENFEVAKDCPYESWTTMHDCPQLNHGRMTWCYRNYLPQPLSKSLLQDPRLSPIHYANFKGLPPTAVYTAQIDVLCSEGKAYSEKLKNEGDAWVEYWEAQGVPHPYSNQTALLEPAREYARKTIERLNEAFSGKLKRS